MFVNAFDHLLAILGLVLAPHYPRRFGHAAASEKYVGNNLIDIEFQIYDLKSTFLILRSIIDHSVVLGPSLDRRGAQDGPQPPQSIHIR